MDEITKKRKIKVEGMSCEDCEKKIVSKLREFEGVKEVTANYSLGEVRIKYDLNKIRLEDIEKVIINTGYKLSTKFFNRMKRGWLKDSEKNELDNLRAKPTSCCSNPEEILNKQ